MPAGRRLFKSSFFYPEFGFVYGEKGAGFGLVMNTNKVSWRKRRQLMNPAFHRKCLKDFMGNFNNVCDIFMTSMAAVVDAGKPTSMNAIKREQIDAARFLKKFASDCTTTRMKDIAAVPDDLSSLLIKNGSLTLDDIIDDHSKSHVEAKFLNEIKEMLGGHDYVEFDDLAKLKYLGQVLEEGLRKYPVAPLLEC
ncbi:cholesterol 24-hydroxylase-like [Paramuricea clavata]|uniref:Cholesterol 24-hydroxylase-like n=1 Tax=Paramuricea clavata TaxID=317549 RepID=A0A6S7L9X0_PARCT|nr:cholesterol 24-hydroxylase-like [Paramuricea clavata]